MEEMIDQKHGLALVSGVKEITITPKARPVVI
jgi:hypothetical protein